jgi:hypothetical protein
LIIRFENLAVWRWLCKNKSEETRCRKIFVQSEVKVIGKSGVIQLPEAFTTENALPKGAQVLLTFKNEAVEAEILPPLCDKLRSCP